MTTITCAKCGNLIEVEEALSGELRRSMEDGLKKEHELEIEKTKKLVEEKLIARYKEQSDAEKKAREEEIIDNRKQNKELRDQLIELTKQLRDEKTARENAEVVMQKKLLEEQDKIRREAQGKSDEENKLKLAELNKKIEDITKVNEDMKRKLEQGSQQLQGEVQELDLERTLSQAFPGDSIEPIGKGVLGADIRQVVKSPLGVTCGTILWESKRTKSWGGDWTSKLKGDMLKDKANIPALLSEALPEEAKTGIGLKDGVWVGSPKFVIPLAMLLRKSLLDIAREKKIRENQQSKAEDLYTYVTSYDFQHQMEAMISTYQEMQEQISRERVSFEKSWKLREAQVTKLLSGAAGMYGSIQGVAGNALPVIKSLELDAGDSDEGKLL